jgi:DNA-binding MarR family transcriptional regulator
MKPTSDDTSLVGALCALYREIGGLHGGAGRKFGLTTSQARLLCLMTFRRPSFGELAGLLGCDKTNVTGMVDRLERRGFLRREPDANDRRVSRVVVTEAGSALADQLRADLATAVDDQLQHWSMADRRRLAALAQAAADAFAGNRP